MKRIPLFALLANVDTTEGRGPMRTIGYTKDKRIADEIVSSDEYARRYGVMGTKCNPRYDVQAIEIVIFDSKEEFINNINNDERKRILEKLTDHEKMILGIKD